MKKILLATLALLCGASAQAETNAGFIDLSVKVAHDVGFSHCDSAIRNAFGHAWGGDIRIWTTRMEATQKDQLQIAGAFGDAGDMVMVDANIRRIDTTCVMTVSTTFDMKQSCPSYLSDNPIWRVESSTGDIMAASNQRGVTALLRPIGNNCLVSMRLGNNFKAN